MILINRNVDLDLIHTFPRLLESHHGRLRGPLRQSLARESHGVEQAGRRQVRPVALTRLQKMPRVIQPTRILVVGHPHIRHQRVRMTWLQRHLALGVMVRTRNAESAGLLINAERNAPFVWRTVASPLRSERLLLCEHRFGMLAFFLNHEVVRVRAIS